MLQTESRKNAGLCEKPTTSRDIVKCVNFCDRVIAVAAEVKRQALAGDPDRGLLPGDVANRVEGYLYDNPTVSAEALFSRALTFYFRQVVNCEEVPRDLAEMLLSGRPIERPEPPAELPPPPRPIRRRRPRRKGMRGRRPWPDQPFAALTDAQWRACAAVLPPPREAGRPRDTDLRFVVEAIAHHWRTGCPWRRLPSHLPPWPTVYSYFRGWVKDGTARRLRAVLCPPMRGRADAGEGGGR